MLEPIALDDLQRLIQRRLAAAAAAGRRFIRDAGAFERHLLTVAQGARVVAEQLQHASTASTRPSPIVCYLAGAWHDAGKIFRGDDYHELASAVELLTHGREWQLVRGDPQEVDDTLVAAARAILPHFAVLEQLEDGYVPTSATRDDLRGVLRELDDLLGVEITAADLLPSTIDAAVLIYCDIAQDDALVMTGSSPTFERRWDDIANTALQHDPAIVPLLPRIEGRVRAAYTRVAGSLQMARDQRIVAPGTATAGAAPPRPAASSATSR